MPFNILSLLVCAAAVLPAFALNCPEGNPSNTTAVRKTYPVPPITVYPIVGNWFNTSWSTIFSFNYSGVINPPTPANSSNLASPNATRVVSWSGYEFDESLEFVNETVPTYQFELRWNLTNPPVKKPYADLTIDGYIQDFKVTASCGGNASLLEWTVEYCASNQQAGWDLFQNRTDTEADNLAIALKLPGATDGTWDIGCAMPVSSTSSASSTAGMPMTSTAVAGAATSTSASTSTKNSQNGAQAMATAVPVYGGALLMVMAAAAVL